MSCNEEVGCKAQHLIYQSVTISTGKGDGSGGDEDGGGSWFTYVFFITILVVTGVSATLFGVFSFYFKNKKKLDELQALEMSDFGSEGGSGELPSNIKVTNDFPSMGGFGGRSATSQGPSSGDGFMDHVRNGFGALGGVLSSLSASASSSSGGSGRFTALQSSSSHNTPPSASSASSSSSSGDTYDPPIPLATGGQSLLGKISSFSPLSKGNNNYEEEDDDITISL